MPASTPMTDPPAERQLQRLMTIAQIAWDDTVPIRCGFRMTKTGVRVYVKQARRNGNAIDQEGSSADAVVKSMEALLITMASHTLTQLSGKPVTEEFLRGVLDKVGT